MKDKEPKSEKNDKVVNFAEHLKVVADNKRKRQERKLTKGEIAIELLNDYKDTAARLRFVASELEKPHSTEQVLRMMQWYLECVVGWEIKNPLQGLIIDYAILMLNSCLDKQEYEAAFQEAKDAKPKKSKPKGDDK